MRDKGGGVDTASTRGTDEECKEHGPLFSHVGSVFCAEEIQKQYQ
jgi:hypothetical protein